MAWCRQAPEESRGRSSSIAGTSRKSMRSLASLLVAIALGAAATPGRARGGAVTPRTLYTDALLQERALRQEIEKRRSDAQAPALLKRDAIARRDLRAHVPPVSNERLHGQRALAGGACWLPMRSGRSASPRTRLRRSRLFSELGARFPRSSQVKESPSHVKRLRAARTTPRDAPPRDRGGRLHDSRRPTSPP